MSFWGWVRICRVAAMSSTAVVRPIMRQVAPERALVPLTRTDHEPTCVGLSFCPSSRRCRQPCSIRLHHPRLRCFSDPETRNRNNLVLISLHHARGQLPLQLCLLLSIGLGAACILLERSRSRIQIVCQSAQRLTDSWRPQRQVSQPSRFLAQKFDFIFDHRVLKTPTDEYSF
jgi:hypothetical protein